MSKIILLAEDSQDDELLFKLVMKRNHIENPVKVVRDGGEAIAYLEGEGKFADRKQHPLPEVLFLDLKMPGIDGFAVLEWLQEHPELRKEILVIVLTNFGDGHLMRRAYDMGANSVLQKPIIPEDVKNLAEHYDGHWMRSDAHANEKS